MDGYSVEEAAEVLGIPQGRVWELIARGVLAGAAEGRSDMRVFLKPVAGSETPRTGADRGNGGGREHAGDGGSNLEASPFRELLTEFRNLTERYGQALLALGEARGEVAALRSRVEVLEARMDMRLPLRSASTVAWELPDRYGGQTAPPPTAADEPPTDVPPAREPELEAAVAADVTLPEPPLPGDEAGSETESAVELEQPAVEVEPEAVAEVESADEIEAGPGTTGTESFPHVRFVHPDEQPSEPPKRRVTGGRAAVAGLAEALARAEDPTLADLPGAREAAAALAALQQADGPARADDSEAGEGGTDRPPDAEPSQPAQPEAAEAEAAPEPSPAAFAQPMTEVEDEREDEPVTADTVDREEGGPAEPVTAEQPEVQPEPSADEKPAMYSTEVVEPDWFADGDFTWLDASDSEREHVERGAEAPAVDALQDAFDRPSAADAPTAPEPEAEPEPEPEPPASDGPSEPGEMEHIDREREAPAAEAIQEAFDEPAAAPESGTEAWPAQDRGAITGSGGVGFGLFRSPDDAPRARVMPTTPSEEEAILWFGDEFEAGDLEVAAPGWRDQERLEAAPPPAAEPEPPAEPGPQAEAGASVPEATAEDRPAPQPEVSEPTDDEIAGLAAQGWDSAEVEAIRSYLGRAPGIAHPQGAEAAGPSTPAHDQDWLRGRRGPAATAYRRLRRLFQG